MKAFLEEYGVVVVAAIVIMIIVVLATPLGNKNQRRYRRNSYKIN